MIWNARNGERYSKLCRIREMERERELMGQKARETAFNKRELDNGKRE